MFSRLENLYPKNAVIDRLRSQYAFEEKLLVGGRETVGGYPEENRTERYKHSPLYGLTFIRLYFDSRWQRDHFSVGDVATFGVRK